MCVVVFVGGTVIPTVLQETEVDAFTHLPKRSYRKERGNIKHIVILIIRLVFKKTSAKFELAG